MLSGFYTADIPLLLEKPHPLACMKSPAAPETTRPCWFWKNRLSTGGGTRTPTHH